MSTDETEGAGHEQAQTAVEIQAAEQAIKSAMQAAEGEAQSEALRQFYVGLPVAVYVTCEHARKAWKRSSAVLLLAHDALAGVGREGKFKAWCELAGINYGSARVLVSRAKRKSVNKVNTSGLFVRCADDEDLAQLKAALRDVLRAEGNEKDNWAVAILVLVHFRLAHLAPAAAAEEAA
jgi:hypothetical protein